MTETSGELNISGKPGRDYGKYGRAPPNIAAHYKDLKRDFRLEISHEYRSHSNTADLEA